MLSEIRWTSFRRNEVNSKAPARPKTDFFADEDRAQRNTVALRDVDYLVTSHFEITGKAGPDDNIKKFEEMFVRRLEKGQTFHQPYLGCREMAADVELASGEERPIALTKPLGLMFFDYAYPVVASAHDLPRPLFFEARLDGGVLRVPPRDVVLRQNGGQP